VLTIIRKNMPTESRGPCPESAFASKEPCDKCPVCSGKFGVTKWKYHCHMCGKVVCDDCSKGKMTLPPLYTSTPVRVCKPCWADAAMLGGKTTGNGRVLGSNGSAPAPAPEAPSNQGTPPPVAGSSDDPAAAERRAKMAAAAAARSAAAPGRPGAKKSTARPPSASVAAKPAAVAAAAPASPPVNPEASSSAVGEAAEPPVAVSAERSAMLEAAMRRKQQQLEQQGGRSQSSTVDPQRIVLLEKVRAKLRSKGMDEPFGLQAMDRVKLQSYLNRLNEM
jgi:hypothetical protein